MTWSDPFLLNFAATGLRNHGLLARRKRPKDSRTVGLFGFGAAKDFRSNEAEKKVESDVSPKTQTGVKEADAASHKPLAEVPEVKEPAKGSDSGKSAEAAKPLLQELPVEWGTPPEAPVVRAWLTKILGRCGGYRRTRLREERTSELAEVPPEHRFPLRILFEDPALSHDTPIKVSRAEAAEATRAQGQSVLQQGAEAAHAVGQKAEGMLHESNQKLQDNLKQAIRTLQGLRKEDREIHEKEQKDATEKAKKMKDQLAKLQQLGCEAFLQHLCQW